MFLADSKWRLSVQYRTLSGPEIYLSEKCMEPGPTKTAISM